MGFKITKYAVDGIEPNKQVQLGELQLCSDPRSVITGTVIDCDGNPVTDAVVKVFSTCNDPCDCDAVLVDLGHVFTDDCGQFMFPVCPGAGQQFLIKIFAVNDNGFQNITPTRCFPDDCCPTCPPCPQ